MPFFDFIYNTFQERVNLPTIQGKPNPYYLPQVLSDIDDPNNRKKKLLPLLMADWNVGTIAGYEGNTIALPIASWYSTYLIQQDKLPKDATVGIPDPATPYPTLALNQVQLNGLSNLIALPAPTVTSDSTGYRVTISLAFNQIKALPPLTITGQFDLQQAVCRADLSSSLPTCNGYSDTVIGLGTFEADFHSDAVVDAQVVIGINGTGVNRSIVLEILALTLRGQHPGTLPTFTVTVLTITKAPDDNLELWLGSANEAFDSPEAQAALIASMNQTLNTADNRNSLSATLLGQLNDGLTNIFGPVPAAGLPDDAGQAVANPVDMYMVDRIWAALNDSSSSYYLPTLLFKSSSPRLEPFTVASLDLGSQTVGGLTWQPNTLSNLAISGLYNNVAPAAQMLLTEPNLSITTTQGALVPPPPGIPAPPLSITGDFSFTMPSVGAVTGSFLITLATSHLQITATASGDRVETLQISLSQLALLVAPAQLTISLTFSPGSSSLAGLAKSIEQNDSVKTTIISQLNAKLAAASLLSSISSQLTDTAKSAIIGQMGGPITTA